MAYTDTFEDTTDGTAADHPVDVSAIQPEGAPELYVPYMREVGGGGAADRIACLPDAVNEQLIVAPPVLGGGLDFLLHAQNVHSIQRGDLYFLDADVAVGVGATVATPHGLGVVPDFVAVCLRLNPGIVTTFNWAATVVDDTNISVKNWSVTAEIRVTIVAIVAHSVFSDLVVGPFDMTLAGVAEVDQAHGLVWPGSGTPIIPGLVSAFPYSTGGVVEPLGGPIMTNLPDDTEWHFGGTDALAAMVLRTYGMYPHSIQQ